MNTQKNLYIGPRTFQRDEGHLFFGRERESRDLIALVASERLVVFYAQSGAGKSSLINTRLLPNLEAKEYEVLPVGRVSGDISTVTESNNIYIYNLIRSLEQHEADPVALSKLSLSHFLSQLNYDEKGFFFDASISDIMPESENATIIRRALVIDQFEELFSMYPEAWEKREDFFRQVAQAMQDDLHLCVVLVMREDYIASLDPYAHLVPGGLRVRYYMQRLGRDAALMAVKSPVEEIRPYAEGVAEKLIDDLCSIKVQKPDGNIDIQPGQYVEPVQLQVVCYGLWENLPPHGTQITDKDLLEVGDVNQSLGKYYDKRVGEIARLKNVKERLIREWFEKKLITAGGIRNMVLQEREAKPGELKDNVIQALQSDLVRAEKRGGATWYELTHDRLVEPILERNKVWFNENLSPLQRQAALWNDQGQNETWLLGDQALLETEQWAAEHQDDLTDIEKEFLEECRTKQKEKEQRQEFESQQQKFIAEQRSAQQRRIIANVSIIATLVTLALAVFGFSQAGNANAQANIAKTERANAESSLFAANTAQADAEFAQATVFASQQKAEEQALILSSNSLAAQSNALRNESFQVSILLGIEAYNKKPTVQSRGALLDIAQANPRLSQILNGHASDITSVAFSPDGKTLASGSNDHMIILWDVKTLQPIGQPLVGHSNAVSSVAFSPDGKTLASGGYDKTILLWDLETHKPIDEPLIGHSNVITSVAFSPDGATLASGSYDQTIILWDVETHQPTGQPLFGHSKAISSVAFSRDGQTLASGSYDNTIILWNVKTHKLIGQPLTGHLDAVISVAFSPDGKILASGSCSKRINDKCTESEVILWNTETRQPIGQPLTGHTDFLTSVAFSSDGKKLASSSYDSTIILWDAEAHQPIGQPLTGQTDIVSSLAFSPDGRTLASGSYDQSIFLWNTESDQPISESLTGHADAISIVAFSPDGTTLASGSCSERSTDKCTKGEVILWDAGTHQRFGQRLIGHTDFVTSVAFSPDGKTLGSGSYDTTIILWDLDSRKPITQLKGHTDIVTSIAFSPDGQTLASSSYDKMIILWDVNSGLPIGQPLSGHKDAVSSVSFSPDGATLASGSYDNTIILWDVDSRQSIGQLTGQLNAVSSVDFSPDGRTLASGSYDNTIILWDMEQLQLTSQLTGHADAISSVAFSPDGTTLASSGNDKTIILWDVNSGLPIGQPLLGHVDTVSSVAFSPDGKTLASSSSDRVIILWDIDPESLIQRSCQRASRNFTQAEWERYFPGQEYHRTCEQWLEGPATIATPIETQVVIATATEIPNVIVPTSIFLTPTAVTGSIPVLFKVVNVTEEDRLNIRAGPGIKYEVIGKIPKDGRGIQVTGPGVQADNTFWLPIVYKGISGWVNSFYLSEE